MIRISPLLLSALFYLSSSVYGMQTIIALFQSNQQTMQAMASAATGRTSAPKFHPDDPFVFSNVKVPVSVKPALASLAIQVPLLVAANAIGSSSKVYHESSAQMKLAQQERMAFVQEEGIRLARGPVAPTPNYTYTVAPDGNGVLIGGMRFATNDHPGIPPKVIKSERTIATVTLAPNKRISPPLPTSNTIPTVKPIIQGDTTWDKAKFVASNIDGGGVAVTVAGLQVADALLKNDGIVDTVSGPVGVAAAGSCAAAVGIPAAIAIIYPPALPAMIPWMKAGCVYCSQVAAPAFVAGVAIEQADNIGCYVEGIDKATGKKIQKKDNVNDKAEDKEERYPGPWHGNEDEWIEDNPIGQILSDNDAVEKDDKWCNQGKRVLKIIKKLNNLIPKDKLAGKILGFDEGDRISVDRVHKDHFEVFDRRGEWKHVANFDGTKNQKLTDRAEKGKKKRPRVDLKDC